MGNRITKFKAQFGWLKSYDIQKFAHNSSRFDSSIISTELLRKRRVVDLIHTGKTNISRILYSGKVVVRGDKDSKILESGTIH